MFDEVCWQKITSGTSNKYIIYPYENGKIIEETTFKLVNPLTYDYLLQNKIELSNRDKGNKTYPAWYAYGRSQSIIYKDTQCVYIPCFIDPKNIHTNIYVHKDVLHYSCLCIEPNHGVDIKIIIDVIIKNINFINDNSSKRSAGWINISSRVLYEIPLE